jgi:hypothetical protein
MNDQRLPIRSLVIFLPIVCLAAVAHAQDNYEIQVYGSDTVPPGSTMVELHSNFTANGSKTVEDGVRPSNHAQHETLEITQGFNNWFETGFYVFTSIQPDGGWQWVGDHIRPRVRIPKSWHWPVGVSLSNEIRYQRRAFSPDTWSWEIRPIVDKKIRRWYLSFNPTLDRSFHGENVNKGVAFSPNASLNGFDPLKDQEQQFFPSIDLDLAPQWEFNFGVGVGVTGATDHLIIKCILGRRFSWRHDHASKAKTSTTGFDD